MKLDLINPFEVPLTTGRKQVEEFLSSVDATASHQTNVMAFKRLTGLEPIGWGREPQFYFYEVPYEVKSRLGRSMTSFA